MNKLLGKKILAVLAAAAVPFTTLLSSAPLTASAAASYIYSDTAQTGLSSHKNISKSATLPARSIAKDTIPISEVDGIVGRTLNYTYTGNIYTANSSLYDYLSNDEIENGFRNSLAEGYTDPYEKFNRAIQNTLNYKTLYSFSSENLTMRYKSDHTGNNNIKVYLFSGSKNNVWAGADMTYDSTRGEYIYTLKYDDLGFQPTGFVICGRDNTNKFWKTNDVSRTLQKGKSYLFQSDNVYEGTADDLYTTSIPLYFGCFYQEYEKDVDNSLNYGADNKGDGTPKGNAHNNFYSNFYWQANMSLRGNYDGAVQGLIDDSLTDGTITQYGIKMPYFNDDWANSHSDMVKYWHNVDFPFYEVAIDANKVRSYGSDSVTGTALYYQFNSREDNLYFDQGKGKYQETDTKIHSQGTVIHHQDGTTEYDKKTVCYLPFNNSDDSTSKNNNLGFGTYFDIKFKIRKDGKVDTVDGNGSVNATFEFMGDDDVWVFIDDKLVLDLGGDHKDTTGIIDFAEKKAYANDATKLGYNSNTGIYIGMDNIDPNITKQMTVDLKDVMAEGTFNSDGTYNQNMTHTLRMFYMERGMYESDLFVRFNFSAIPNDSNLKIKEITNFKDINPGLVDLTKKAADYDVFDYSISNSGTSAEDVGKSGILSPTYNFYERDVLGQKALLSGQEYIPYIYLDTSQHLSGGDKWSTKNAGIAAKLTGNGSAIVYGEKMADDLYRFDVSGGYTSVDFQRLNPSDNSVWNHANLGGFTIGSTYKITDWGTATLTNEGSGPYTEHDFDPTQGNSVKNVNYIWTDDAASTTGTDKNGLTGTTDASGSFNLMYGTATQYGSDSDKESSAEFQKQFKKDSSMTVVQNDDLRTVKRDGKVEDFSSTRSRTVGEYYDTTVSIVDKGGYSVTNNGTNTNTKYTYANTSAVDPNDSVQITETFVNTPKVYSLRITKKLDPNDDVSENFTFRLALTNIFGIAGINAGSNDYAKLDIIINGIKQPLGSSAEFTLQRNQTAMIEGIPYGTSYAITEVIGADSSYEPKDNENPSGTIGQDDSGTPTNTDSQETVVNTRKTGELELEKQLIDNNETESGINNGTLFTFKVVLENTEVNLDDYMSGFKYQTTSMTDAEAVDGSTDTVVYDKDSKTFTVQVSVNESVVLSGLPYGTTYSVSEENVPENWTSAVTLTGATFIGDESSSVTVGNTYTPPAPKYGSLKISKNVLGANGSESIPDEMRQQKFTFTVTLKDVSGAPLNDTFVTELYVSSINQSSTLNFDETGKATVLLADDDYIIILNIPVDSTYTVEESVNAEYDTTFEGATGTIEENATAEAKFTNTKKFIPYTLPESGFDDTRMYFVFALSGMMLCGLAYFFINRQKVKD